MRYASLLSVTAMLLAGCNPVQVTTTVAPDAHLANVRTFRVLNVPPRRAGISALPNDPMLDNSITNRALRDHLSNAFVARGYVLDATNPDFTVAYYTSRHGELDVSAWDYGYPGRWGGWRARPGMVEVRSFTEGTIIVDVVNAATHELIWRGRGVSEVSDDPELYAQDLERAVKEIVKRFPAR